MEPVRFIGEIGCNHQGDMDVARKMVKQLAVSGVWGVKGQKRDIEAHPDWKTKPYTGKHSFGKTYYEHRKALELRKTQHIELAALCAQEDVEYFCSVWDLTSLIEMSSICSTVKIPSCYCDRLDMMTGCVGRFSRIIVSTGMSNKEETEDVLEWANTHVDDFDDIVIMMCTSKYPCHPEDIHLSLYNWYRENLHSKIEVGFSGHHSGRAIDVAAYAIGCRYIERHVTLDPLMKGSDHYASLPIAEIMSHVNAFDKIRTAFGPANFEKQVLDCEKSSREKLRD